MRAGNGAGENRGQSLGVVGKGDTPPERLRPTQRGSVPISDGMRIEEAARVAAEVKRLIAPYCSQVHTAGSIRRGRPVVHDVDIVCVPLDAVKRDLMRMELVRWGQVIRNGEKMVSVRRSGDRPSSSGPSSGTKDEGREDGTTVGVQVEVYIATPENVGMLMVVRTGSMEHNIWLAQRAKWAGMKFAAGSGIERDGKIIAGKTEDEVFAALGICVPAPGQREIGAGKPWWMR